MAESTTRMRALELQAPGQLMPVELARPAPQADELLVRTVATTICTSDLHDIRSNPWGMALPRVLGHEAAGVVAGVGSGVSGFAIGDRVAVHPVIPCGGCVECRAGLGHLCVSLGHLGVDRGGTFAEYFCIPATRARRLPESVDPAQAALLEPVAVCMEAVRRARVESGGSALVVGDGPFGVIISRLLIRAGVRTVIVGRHDFRLQRAAGAAAVNVAEPCDPMAAVRAALGPRGADAAILAVDAQEALDLCIAAVRPRGRVVVFAVMPSRPRVDMLRLLAREIELVGACNDEDLLDASLGAILADELDLGSVVTHRFPFEKWQEAFSVAAHRPESALKVALVFK